MSRSRPDLYVAALDVLLLSKMAAVARNRDWELLREVARLADEDAPRIMAVTDPALFQSWRAAATRFHVAGGQHDAGPRRQSPATCSTRHGSRATCLAITDDTLTDRLSKRGRQVPGLLQDRPAALPTSTMACHDDEVDRSAAGRIQ